MFLVTQDYSPFLSKPLKERQKAKEGRDDKLFQPETPDKFWKVQGDEDVEMTHGTQQNDANSLLEKGPQDAVGPCSCAQLALSGTRLPRG